MLNEENGRLLDRMTEIKQEYEKSSDIFLNELRTNTKFIKSLREKIKNLQVDRDQIEDK